MVEELIKIPIYNTKIKIVITDDIDKYAKENEIDDRGLKNYQAIVYNFCDFDREFDLIVLFNEPKHGDIVHEVFHLTCALMRHIGCPLTNESEEAYAYLNEYIDKAIRQVIIKHKKVEE